MISEDMKIFLLEAYEKLDEVEQGLLAAEQTPGDLALLNKIFRAIHTIKGNSGFLALTEIETLCHRGEALLDRLRNGTIQLSSEAASALLAVVDALRNEFATIEATGNSSSGFGTSALSQIEKLLR